MANDMFKKFDDLVIKVT